MRRRKNGGLQRKIKAFKTHVLDDDVAVLCFLIYVIFKSTDPIREPYRATILYVLYHHKINDIIHNTKIYLRMFIYDIYIHTNIYRIVSCKVNVCVAKREAGGP